MPTVNNNTITLTQGGETKGTFTLNQGSDQTIDLDASSTPTNMVTTDTAQEITGAKVFKGSYKITCQSTANEGASVAFKASSQSSSDYPIGVMEIDERLKLMKFIVNGVVGPDYVPALGYFSNNSNYNYVAKLPKGSDKYNSIRSGDVYLPLSVNGTKADSSGNVALTNMVTTDTTQNIRGEKTFIGSKRIKFKQSLADDKLGFTLYDRNNNEKGYLEYNPTDDGMYIGRYGDNRVNELGFKTGASYGGGTHKLLVPNVTLRGTVTDYIPISVNGTKADDTGNISIAIPDVSNYYTKNEVDNLIPTAGTGININNKIISVDDDIVAMKTDIPTVVDTVAEGNMNAVTSNAVYDIVGDIETLLSEL